MRVSPARTFLILMFMALAVLSTACGSLGVGQRDLPSGAYAPHPDFERFYLQNGGYDLFGYAISTSYTNQLGERFQYFETVLMKYHPATKQVSFVPLGLDLGVANLPTLPWEGGHPDDGLLVGEYTVHPAFVDLFLSLGPDLTGLPVTQPFVNPGRNRVEQHFENLGMYYQLDDPEQAAMLLDYGLVHCTSCQPNLPGAENAIIQQPLTEPFFYNQMERFSISPSTSGEVLRGPVQTPEGTTELVFEHMVLAAVNGEMVIRPLPVLLGLKDEFLYAPIDHPAMVFYEISGGIGHNVISPFDAYIQRHGGYAVSGQPITEAVFLNPELRQVRQCFENYCLDFLPDLPGENVRPVRLGDQYLKSGILQDTDTKTVFESSATQVKRRTNPFTLIVWEHPTVVESQTPETISVMVALENTPQPGMEVVLTIEYPDGSEVQIQMPPTAENGVTSLTLDPVVAQNGDLVFYDACLMVQGTTQLCVEQSFMIWGNP